MRTRPELQEILESLLGSSNVYFQPPASISLKYPCIIYDVDRTDVNKANNKIYIHHNQYHLQHIFKGLQNEKKDKLLDTFQLISHDARNVFDNLYHDEFTLYW